jgi:cytochrome bd-type quinol oxidase subunit 2
MAREKSEPARQNPRQSLSRASTWLGVLGGALTLIGAILMITAFASSDQEGRFSHVMRGFMALAGCVVPGLIYLICAWAIPRRQRWSITAADLVTWLQMFFAGAMAILSMLQIKLMWPWMILGMLWIIPLLLVPRLTAPLAKAMDLIAQIPELGIDPKSRARRV